MPQELQRQVQGPSHSRGSDEGLLCGLPERSPGAPTEVKERSLHLMQERSHIHPVRVCVKGEDFHTGQFESPGLVSLAGSPKQLQLDVRHEGCAIVNRKVVHMLPAMLHLFLSVHINSKN